MPHFINVILPIPLQRLFTYKITQAEVNFLEQGMRVVVPFGKSKLYTAIVFSIHKEAPTAYKAKEIYQILDKTPIITAQQFKHWQWLASYYMCTLGEVLRAALPSAFLLESETLIVQNSLFDEETILSDDEFLIFEALQHQSDLKIKDVSAIIQKKHVVSLIHSLLKKGLVELKESLYQKYKPKFEKYVKINKKYLDKNALNTFLNQLKNAPKQRELVLQFFTLSPKGNKSIVAKKLLEKAQSTAAVLKVLETKEFFDIFYEQIDRVQFVNDIVKAKTLSKSQNLALNDINESFKIKDVCLLHGVTSSGKTEIYVSLIQEVLKQDKQVLFLLPEIALTTQLISRLKAYFGSTLAVFHSKYSLNERVEVWQNLLENSDKGKIIIGARSAVLLPFSNLGLIVVDEEHESSYKQFDPAPRYHARDVAIVLAHIHKAKVILGSATPSVESYFNAQNNKYGLVALSERFGAGTLPNIELIDLKEKYKKKQMNGFFSDVLLEGIKNRLAENKQIILFQNRRGYAPIVTCTSCGVVPHCPNCDVSLTLHKIKNNLQCHYCGFHEPLENKCKACNNPTLSTQGFGTEQIVATLQDLLPNVPIGRMDFDTTRGKYAYQKIISDFERGDTKILVGTQMLAKGLDFSNVTLVGVLQADSMLNFPDFRAHERSFQLLQQVAGRSGRNASKGKVIIQTFNPFHKILQQVKAHAYFEMYAEQLNERCQHQYPPYLRMVKIILKHKNPTKLYKASDWLGKSLNLTFNNTVLGPTDPPIPRIRNLYAKTFLIKFSKNQQLKKSKLRLLKVKDSFMAIAEFRSVRFIIDVDNY
ncbi:MAG: primosomal protein N' [Flavobacteriaceae bacterium]|nr:primosomal protein N' [Flavobacteriaceae bacterium]